MRVFRFVAFAGVAGLATLPGPVPASVPSLDAHLGAVTVTRAAAPRPADSKRLPAGFRDRVVKRVVRPTGLAWTPGGRMLVTSKLGQLYVFGVHGGRTKALDLRRPICSSGDRGLTSVAVDPNFDSNHYVYLYWTHDAHHDCTSGRPATLPEHRVVRYVLRDDDRIARRGRKVIVDHIVSNEMIHNSDDLTFGAGGFLYISVGDGLCRIGNRARCGQDNDNAQRRNLPQGKVLRVNRRGLPPSSNPYTKHAGARRCTRPASVQRERGPCKEIYASGFRNPWRLASRPGTGAIFVNDVGLYTWEEIDRLDKRGSYGWNAREGHCSAGSTTNCGHTRFDNPVFDYQHGACEAITGGAFVPPSSKVNWPRRFVGKYLFTDFECGRIFRLVQKPGGGSTRATFLTGAGTPVDLAFGPYRHTKALYYLDHRAGTVHRVSYHR
ncbi:MAG: PQQ-dependent sugar dehydrogenase [Nocardioidaceae bacterium]